MLHSNIKLRYYLRELIDKVRKSGGNILELEQFLKTVDLCAAYEPKGVSIEVNGRYLTLKNRYD